MPSPLIQPPGGLLVFTLGSKPSSKTFMVLADCTVPTTIATALFKLLVSGASLWLPQTNEQSVLVSLGCSNKILD